MSIRPIEAYAVYCDRCGDQMHDDEFAGVVVYFTTDAASAAVKATKPSEDDWCKVGDAHFCHEEHCQEAARQEIRENASRLPVKNLPGQLALLGEVDGVPVPYEVLP